MGGRDEKDNCFEHFFPKSSHRSTCSIAPAIESIGQSRSFTRESGRIVKGSKVIDGRIPGAL